RSARCEGLNSDARFESAGTNVASVQMRPAIGRLRHRAASWAKAPAAALCGPRLAFLLVASLLAAFRARGLRFQLHRHLLDRAGECERQLVAEVDGRAAIHADVEPLADGDLDRNGPLQPTVRNSLAVGAQRDGGALAHA